MAAREEFQPMRRTILAALCVLAFLLPLASEETSYPGLFRYHLDNGLELFVYRDSAVPLARVEICFRAGAMAQTPDTAGLFHLYEHVVFGGASGGEASSGGSDTVKSALSSIGAVEWNGGTSAERVDWWLSLPSANVDKGIQFWADHIRPASFSPDDLNAAKDTVAAEIKALDAGPDAIYQAAMDKRLFGKYPWRRDPAGNEAGIRAATPEAMSKIRDTWFVPNNAAVFVGGDVDPEAVHSMAAAAFAGWKAGENPWKKPSPVHPKPGVARPTWMVYPDPSMPEGMAFVELRYRGPDLITDPQASYAADLWTSLVADPAGRFKASVVKNVPKLNGADPISAYYISQREGSTLSISAYFAIDPESSAVDRARQFKERVRGYEITTMRSDPGYFSASDYDAARRRLDDARRKTLETPDGVVNSLAYWWAASSGDYFIGYADALAKIGPANVVAFLDAYVLRNLEVIALRMNPTDFEREKKSFANSGFDVVSQSNAFWWQK
jgi:zinc protease